MIPFSNKNTDLLNSLQARNKKPFDLRGYPGGDPTIKLLSNLWLKWIPTLIQGEDKYHRYHNWVT